MKEIEYRVAHRANYYAIDLYIEGKMKRTIQIGLTKKEAELWAGDLENACQTGYDYLIDQINKQRI